MSKNLLEKAKTLLGRIEVVLSKVEGKIEMMAEGKLSDGTMVASPSDEFEVGGELFVISAEGEPTPAPDGEHTLEDGTKVVTEGGIIKEIISVEAGADKEEEEAELDSVLAQLSERVAALEAANAAQSAELASVKGENETLKTDLASAKSDLANAKSEIVKLSKAPAAESVKKIKVDLKKEEVKTKPFHQMTYLERIQAGSK